VSLINASYVSKQNTMLVKILALLINEVSRIFVNKIHC